MNKKHNPTQLQYDIISSIKSSRRDILVEAVAGSGKTTTIVDAISQIKGKSKLKVIFVAFNKHIADELRKKLPKSVTVSTLHALGKSCVIKANRGEKVEVDEYDKFLKQLIRSTSINDTWFSGKDDDYISEYRALMLKLLKLCKLQLALEGDKIRSVVQKYDFIKLQNIDIQRAEHLLKLCVEFGKLNYISFDDMIFYPAIEKVESHGYDVVFVDECQDLNIAQQAFIQKMLDKKNGRLIAVGDSKQAIYGFAGADSSSFNKMKSRENVKILPLSQCFRCGKSIIDFVKSVNPDIEAFERNHEGEVRYGSYNDLRESDMVLCRNNAPLVSLHRKLIQQNKPAIIKGKEIGKELVNLVQPFKGRSISDLMSELNQKRIKKINLLKKLGLESDEIQKHIDFITLNERIQILNMIAKDCKSVTELIRKLNSIYKESEEGIILSSIHKSKGLEADRVFILFDDLTPSPYASQTWEIEQEKNLIYVAYTRAKNELIFINDFDEHDLEDRIVAFRSKRFNEYRVKHNLVERH